MLCEGYASLCNQTTNTNILISYIFYFVRKIFRPSSQLDKTWLNIMFASKGVST